MNENVTGLYAHIPFCVSRCKYCDFPTTVFDHDRAEWYLTALETELALRCRNFSPRTIYVGGGTPTSLPDELFVAALSELGRVSHECLEEYSFEANPGTVNMKKLFAMRKAGVNRISFGVQSFSQEGLELLGRIHSAKQVRGAVAMAREVGFENISLDLIYGWPGQSLGGWQEDMEAALNFGINHMSCYPLTYEPGTPLAELVKSGIITPLGEDEERELFDFTGAFLKNSGLPRYEVSSFAVPGYECQHNLNYWKGGEYLGVGSAAHSHIDGRRIANEDNVDKYCRMMLVEGAACVFEESLPPEQKAKETAVIWLRMTEGIDARSFHSRTGFMLEELFEKELPSLLDNEWLEWTDAYSFLRLTENALPISDSILSDLIN